MKTSQRLRLSTDALPFLRRNLRNLRIVPKTIRRLRRSLKRRSSHENLTETSLEYRRFAFSKA